MQYGIELSTEGAEFELFSTFTGDTFFNAESQEEALESLLKTAKTAKERNSITQFFKDLLDYFRAKLGGDHNVTLELVKLQNRWANLIKETAEKISTADNSDGMRWSIGVLENGNIFVIHDRNVITATDVSGMRKQITEFFNDLLEEKESIDIPTIDGEVLTITKNETANKARDNYKTENGKRIKLSNEEFAVKLRAESHIDELAETSKKISNSSDKKSHPFAKDGFTYRTAYFEDYDGQYYKITLSIGNSNNVATIYNIGNIKEDQLPSAKLIAVVGSKPLGNKSSKYSIPNSAENVNKNISANNTKSEYSVPRVDSNEEADGLTPAFSMPENEYSIYFVYEINFYSQRSKG